MINHSLFSSKDKSKKIKCRLLLFLFCTLRVKQWRENMAAYPDRLNNPNFFISLTKLNKENRTSLTCFRPLGPPTPINWVRTVTS